MNARHHPGSTRLSSLILVGALVVSVAPTAGADEPVPVDQDGVPSFNESPGCGALDGVRGPLASESGLLPMSEPIYGPWADFYGRSIESVWEQLVPFQLPGQAKTLYVHERVMPAMQTVLDNLAAEAAAGRTYPISSNTWSWSRYTIPPTRRLSFHTVGAAIDVNSTTNPYRADNVLITDMPDWFVEAWTSAGWCWGGDWQTIKDPMHFSWMGPLHTDGYEMPRPQPPLVGPASFRGSIPLATGLARIADDDHRDVVVDTDRDGAVDVVRVEPFGPGGEVGIRSAIARHSHETCRIAGVTATAPSDHGAPMLLDDLSQDGRPDLAYVLDGGGEVRLEVFTNRQWGPWQRSTIDTEIPYTAGSTYLLADADRDGANDLFVVSPGDPARLEIWSGRGFTDQIGAQELGAGSTARFTTGDRDVDGLPDLYAIDAAGTLTVHLAADRWRASEIVATAADDPSEAAWGADLDGDGHTDLVMVTPDGDARLLRGGASTHNPGAWYLDDEWQVRQGCLDPAVDDMTVPRVPSAVAGTMTVVAVPEYPGHTRYVVMRGIETLRETELAGVPVDITSVSYRGNPIAYVLLDTGSRFKARPLVVTSGPRPPSYRFARHDAIGITGLDRGVAILQAVDGRDRAKVLVRRFDGDRSTLRFGYTPVAMAATDTGIAVLGTTDTGRPRIVLKTLGGDRLAARSFAGSLDPISLSPSPGGFIAVLRDGDGVVVHRLDEALRTVDRIPFDDVAFTAVTPTGSGFLIARATPGGDGLVESRGFDGSVSWWRPMAPGYAPAALADSTLVAVTGQRVADGAAILVLIDPGTGDVAYSDTLP